MRKERIRDTVVVATYVKFDTVKQIYILKEELLYVANWMSINLLPMMTL